MTAEMTSLLNQLIYSLVLIVLLSTCTLSAPFRYLQSSQQLETWLSDQAFYDLDKLEDQDDRHNGDELCPPVPQQMGADSCGVATCRTDRDCVNSQFKCCYNGCVFTCLPHVKPAPHFDWINEPVRQIQYGQSWLVPGPNDDPNVAFGHGMGCLSKPGKPTFVMCSTTLPDDDSDPLICPHGYTCSVDASVEQKDVPDRGRCVKVVDDVTVKALDMSDIQNDQPPSSDNDYDTALKHACYIDDGQLLISGHYLVMDGQKCLCHDKQLTCND